MKTLVAAIFASIILAFFATEGYADCRIVDSKGREMRSADCFTLLLRVETDQFISTGICRVGSDECDHKGFRVWDHQVLNQYYTAPWCQGEIYLYSPARSLGYLFEPVQMVDEWNFYYPQWKGGDIGGSAIISYWDGAQCYDSTQWWDDRTVFAKVTIKRRADFDGSVTGPFRIPR